MAHKVKCFYCQHVFDRDKEPFMAIPDKSRRYAHKECFLRAVAVERANQQDKENLEEYIKELFNYKVLPEAVNKQIRQYTTENNYTYSGILKALKYFYEVKHGSKEKAYGRIGIVPYVYDTAHNYYLAIWQARERNEQVKTNEYVLPTVEIRIPVPQRKPMRGLRRLFRVLDDAANINVEELINE